MAKFLTTTLTSAYLEDIITKAVRHIYLFSPYLKISKNLYERLLDADQRNVQIFIVYGKQELTSEQSQMLSKIKHLSLYFMDNLHAKCYFNENNMIITSMNMYEFSEKNNREMGIALNLNEDRVLFLDAQNEAYSILKHSTNKSTTRPVLDNQIELDYKNWKVNVHHELEKLFDTTVYFHDRKYTIEYKSRNHTIICDIVKVNGENRFLVSKILTGMEYEELKKNKIFIDKKYIFSLDSGSSGSYAMAHLELRQNLRTESLNFVYAQDVAFIYATILEFGKLIQSWG